MIVQFIVIEIGKRSLKMRSERTFMSHEKYRGGETKDKSMTDLDWLGRIKRVGVPSLRQMKENAEADARRAAPVLLLRSHPHSV